MTTEPLLDRAGVARRLSHTVNWFYDNYPALLTQGFPAPALGTMKAARWDPVAIDLWLAGKRHAQLGNPHAPHVVDAADLNLAAEAAELNQRSANIDQYIKNLSARRTA